MISYILRKNTNEESKVFGKYFAFPVISETVELSTLAEHMAKHNTPFSKGVIAGLLIDMVECVKELLLQGKNVKIDDLAIFSIGIRNTKGGAESEEKFIVTKNIAGVKLRSRATGSLTPKALMLDASLKRVTTLAPGQTIGAGGESGDDEGNDGDTRP